MLPVNSDKPVLRLEEPASLISFDSEESPLQSEIIRQPSPPPVLAEVQDLMPTAACPIEEVECGLVKSSPDGLICSEDPLQLHIVRFFYIFLFNFLVVHFLIVFSHLTL